MSYVIKQIYNKYFQKSKCFLFPVLGIKKESEYIPIQSFLTWKNVYTLNDYNLILTYENSKSIKWHKYIINIIMNNRMFNEFFEINENIVAISFDLHAIQDDYDKIIKGKYSQISKQSKIKIRNYFGYNSPEWAYMESFLFPEKYIKIYSKILNVDEIHIRHTGELCDLPDFNKETLKIKIKTHAKLNDVDQINMESRKNI